MGWNSWKSLKRCLKSPQSEDHAEAKLGMFATEKTTAAEVIVETNVYVTTVETPEALRDDGLDSTAEWTI